MPYTRRARPAAAFTLIEVMVAISLLAILTTLVASELRTGLNASSAIHRETERQHARHAALSILQEQLRDAIPLEHQMQEGVQKRPVLSFDGNSSSIRFVSRSSFADGPTGIPRWIECAWEHPFESPTGWLKVYERRILSPGNNPERQPSWTGRILEGKDLHFRYLRRANGDRGLQWETNWDMSKEREMPAAVRIIYSTTEGESVFVIPIDSAPSTWKGFLFR